MTDRIRDAIRERWLAGDTVGSLAEDFGYSLEVVERVCVYRPWDVAKGGERLTVIVPSGGSYLQRHITPTEARALAVSLLSATDADVADRLADILADTPRFLAIDNAIADVVNANVGTWVREDAEQKLIRLLADGPKEGR
jgi:hypothetical protein